MVGDFVGDLFVEGGDEAGWLVRDSLLYGQTLYAPILAMLFSGLFLFAEKMFYFTHIRR